MGAESGIKGRIRVRKFKRSSPLSITSIRKAVSPYKCKEAGAILAEAEKEAEVVQRKHTATYLKFEIQDMENEFKAMGDNQPNADGEEYDEWMERYISLANKITDAREELTTNGLKLVELRK